MSIYITLLLLLFPRQVYAYLDPGTGSYFFQVLIAGLLGSLFFIKTVFRRIKNYFKPKTEKRDNGNDEEDEKK